MKDQKKKEQFDKTLESSINMLVDKKDEIETYLFIGVLNEKKNVLLGSDGEIDDMINAFIQLVRLQPGLATLFMHAIEKVMSEKGETIITAINKVLTDE